MTPGHEVEQSQGTVGCQAEHGENEFSPPAMRDQSETETAVKITLEKLKVRFSQEQDLSRRFSIAMGEIDLLLEAVFPGIEPIQENTIILQALAVGVSLPDARFNATDPGWAQHQEQRLFTGLYDILNLQTQAQTDA